LPHCPSGSDRPYEAFSGRRCNESAGGAPSGNPPSWGVKSPVNLQPPPTPPRGQGSRSDSSGRPSFTTAYRTARKSRIQRADYETKAVPEDSVQRVAQSSITIEQRVGRLRDLAAQVTGGYLALAVTLHEEHEAELWTKAGAETGAPYRSEEEFWEE